MPRSIRNAILVLSLVVFARAARGDVTVTLDQSGNAAMFAAQFGFDVAELQNRLTAEVQEVYNLIDPKKFLEGFADAASFSSKGLGADYASDASFFSLGAAVNVSLASGDLGFHGPTRSERPIDGVAPNASITAGVNIGTLTANALPILDGLTVYANAFHLSHRFQHDYDFDITNFGTHLQYKLLERHGVPILFSWNGVAATVGFEYSKINQSLSRNLKKNLNLAKEGEPDITVVMDSVGTLSVNAKTYAVPIELTTGVSLLSIATIYGGLGLDIVGGSAKMDADLDGDFTGVAGSTSVPLGGAKIQANESGGPSGGRLRFLVGAQVNIFLFHLFGQLNVAPDSATGVTAGLRFAY